MYVPAFSVFTGFPPLLSVIVNPGPATPESFGVAALPAPATATAPAITASQSEMRSIMSVLS